MDLSKSDKKVCRDLIEKGLQREFARGLQKANRLDVIGNPGIKT